MKHAIVVVGSLNMDLVVHTVRHPKPGETVLGKEFQTFPGGKGANQAVAAARLDSRVFMVGCVGQDDFGDVLIETLEQDRVQTEFVYREEQERSGVALITVDNQGQNSIVVAPGANSCLSQSHLIQAEAAFTQAKVVVLQLEIPLEVVATAIELAAKHGAQVILNPAPAQALGMEILSAVDYLIPNESELDLLTNNVTGRRPSESAAHLKAMGVKNVVVTLGSQGVLVLNRTDPIYLAPHTVQVVDTTAAGDAFIGAFAVALAEGRLLIDCARLGNAAGALAVTRQGAQPSLPYRKDVERLLNRSSIIGKP